MLKSSSQNFVIELKEKKQTFRFSELEPSLSVHMQSAVPMPYDMLLDHPAGTSVISS